MTGLTERMLLPRYHPGAFPIYKCGATAISQAGKLAACPTLGVNMIYKLARLLQFAGLAVLPVAIAGNAADKMSLKNMLLLSAGGMFVFYLGWQLQQTVKPR